MRLKLANDTVTTDVRNCVRCKQDHRQLKFKELAYPMIDSGGVIWRFWAKCPKTGAPIMLRHVRFGEDAA